MTTSLLPLTTGSLLSWLGQSTLLLGLAWLFYWLLLRRERGFQYNRRFLLAAPWLALLLPALLTVLTPWLPTWQTTPAVAQLVYEEILPTLTVQATGGAAAFSWTTAWLPLLYGAVVVLLLLRLGGQLLHLWLTTRHWPRQPQAGYTLVHTGGQRPVSSFGRWVFWNETAGLSPAEAAQVLRHEVAHVQQRHTAERLALEVARTLLWACPFVHFFPGALELTHEFLADEAAIRPTAAAPVAAESYTALLARVALRQLHPDLPLTHSFTQSFTLTRIRMLTSHAPVRRWKQWLALPLSTVLLGLIACEKAVELPPPPPPVVVDAPQVAPPPPPPAVYFYVEKMPEYTSGQTQLMADLSKLLTYPTVAKDAKLEGRAFVKFIVAEDGTMQAVELAKGATAPKGSEAAAQALNEAALTAVRNLPGKWKPGYQDGKPVAVFFTVPISFAL